MTCLLAFIGGFGVGGYLVNELHRWMFSWVVEERKSPLLDWLSARHEAGQWPWKRAAKEADRGDE